MDRKSGTRASEISRTWLRMPRHSGLAGCRRRIHAGSWRDPIRNMASKFAFDRCLINPDGLKKLEECGFRIVQADRIPQEKRR